MTPYALRCIAVIGLLGGSLAAQDTYINEHWPASFGLFVTITSPALGTEPYVVDLSTGAATLLRDIQPGSASSSPRAVIDFGNLILFRACSVNEGCELWRTDGTPGGTFLLKDISPGPAHTSVEEPLVYGGKAYLLVARNSAFNKELWVTDGTEAGTLPVFVPPTGGVTETEEYKGNLYIGAGGKLYVSQGTAASMLRDFGDTVLNYFEQAGGLLFFVVYQTNSTELWVTDGTAAGTSRLRAFPLYPFSQGVYPLGDVRGKLVFLPAQLTADRDLWISDGTPLGTRRITEIAPGGGNGFGRYWASTGTLGFFDADHPTHGTELWVTDTTALGTRIVVDLAPGTGSSRPAHLTPLNNGIVFTWLFGASPELAGELWFSDGSAAGTYRIKEVRPDSDAVALGGFVKDDSIVYFLAGQSQLWRTDGTAAGTVMVFDAASLAAARR
jgi:ELWxxDGT repeat protein